MTTPTVGFVKANADADTPITLYVRDDAGPVDLTGESAPVLLVSVRRFGASMPISTFPASGDANGRVSFTVTANDVRRTLFPGVYAYRLTIDGVQAQTGVLEVAA
jgi:hypothetical protein